MKPGDKVWWFDPRTQTIECSIVRNTNERGNIVFTYTLTLVIGHDGFPTREALCEHYRKIFGGIDRKVLLDGINALKKDAKERHEDDCYLHGLYDVMDMINEELG